GAHRDPHARPRRGIHHQRDLGDRLSPRLRLDPPAGPRRAGRACPAARRGGGGADPPARRHRVRRALLPRAALAPHAQVVGALRGRPRRRAPRRAHRGPGGAPRARSGGRPNLQETMMAIELIGMIGVRPEGADGAAVHVIGGEVDLAWVRDFSQAHERAGFDKVLVGYPATSADGFLVSSYAAAHTERLGYLIAHRPGFVAPT